MGTRVGGLACVARARPMTKHYVQSELEKFYDIYGDNSLPSITLIPHLHTCPGLNAGIVQ